MRSPKASLGWPTSSVNTVNKVFIGLGSNVGDGLNTLLDAWQELGECENICLNRLSSPYISAPVGMESRSWFTNAVGNLETDLSPEQLLDEMFEVEESFGRRRQEGSVGYKDRTLDLDILFFEDMILKSQKVILPHPHMGHRLFVLQPLVEIAPGFKHPENGRSLLEMEKDLLYDIKNGDMESQEIFRKQWPSSNEA